MVEIRAGVACAALAALLALGGAHARAADAEARGITVGSFNIAWLGDGVNDHELPGNRGNRHGKHLRGEADFEGLRGVIAGLGADIVVLQEVENEAAVRRVLPTGGLPKGNLPTGDWQVFVSRRKAAAEWPQRVAIAARPGLGVRRLPDVAGLALDSGGLRNGVDLEISHGKQRFRLLGIHLKSFCFTGEWAKRKNNGCEKLWRQLPPLKEWIAARAAEAAPFVIAGDWNRAIHFPGDAFWAEIDDGNPAGLRLAVLGQGAPRNCWNKENSRVNHIVLGDSKAVHTWLPEKAGDFAEHALVQNSALKLALSDHCPITARLRFAAPD